MAIFGKKWTSAELAIIANHDDLQVLKTKLPDRTEGAIKSKIRQLNNTPWTSEEITQFPENLNVDKATLISLADTLSRDRDFLWKKLKSLGYVWVKSEEDSPYPDHGKKWTPEELALFPENKLINADILAEVQKLFPRRKPTSIWPKMKKEGYIWDNPTEDPTPEVRTPEEEYVLSLAYELGFRTSQRGMPSLEPALNTKDYRDEIARKFHLKDDFNSGDLLYAIITRLSPLPWDMGIEEVALAYRNRDKDSIKAAAKALRAKLDV